MTREKALKVIRGEINLCEEESVDALELEDVYSLVEHSIALDRIKKSREEISEMRKEHNVSVTDCLDVLDKLIAEVEG